MENTTFSSGLALVFGALHALEPGHGKTALLTYIASGKRSWKEGIVISVTSAITHSLAIFFIAFASHFLLHHGMENDGVPHIRNILSAISGTLICGLGIWTICKGRKKVSEESCHACVGHQTHGENTLSRNSFLTSGVLGIATGIIPCPTALVAYLSGVSSGNSFLGIQNVICFACGMCFSLMGAIVFFSLSGKKLIQKLKNKRTTLNWSLIQGVLFIVIGLGTAFYH